MKGFLFISILATLILSNSDCSQNNKDVYKGRLEIKGICSNYTISVLEGDIDTSRIEASWTDENTGKSYNNVFRLDQPCTFPDTIDAGEEFYFRIDTTERECTVCMAYYPVPRKGLAIKVVDK
jgi:hypothetical protein